MHILESSCGGILINHIQFGEGKDVIFLHGWGGDIRSFLGCAKIISKNFRVTLVDFYGFGKTPSPPYPLVLDDYADSIAEIITYYEMKNVFLVGHSFGGRVAIRLAVKYSHLLGGVVIADGAGVKPRRSIKYYLKIGCYKLLKRLNIKYRGGSEDYKKLSPLMQQTFKFIVNENQTNELSKINLPVLLIWGDKDKDTPIYMAKKMLRKINSSSLIIFRKAGHFAYVERHNLFAEILKKFLSDGGNEVDNSNSYVDFRKRRIVKIPYLRSKK